MALHFSHSKSQSPYKRPGRPTRSTLSCPPNCPVSALTSSPTALPFTLFRLHKPFCVAPAFALPGVPFPQIVTWLMPSPSSSLHTNVISMQPILIMLFEIVTLPTPLPPGLSTLLTELFCSFVFFHSTCYLLTLYMVCCFCPFFGCLSSPHWDANSTMAGPPEP